MQNALDSFFRISERGSSISRELRAGATSFLAMGYILIVNPLILANAIDVPNAIPQLVTVTALAAAAGTLLMAFWANLPFALAPGMGLNAYFTYTVVLSMGLPWQTALGAVFVSGILFAVIAITGLRAWILDAIPLHLKHAITAGIGAFLAMIGFVGAGWVEPSPATLVTAGNFSAASPWVALAGLVVTGALLARKVPGAILIGILLITLAAVFTPLPVYRDAGGSAAFPGFDSGIFGFTNPADILAQLDIAAALGLGLASVVFTFLFVDFFDSAGTLIGLSAKAGMLDSDGRIEAPRAAFASDGIATSIGAVFGTSSTTCYIESAAGIEEGGRTGLTALVVAALFLAGMLFSPLAQAVPTVATAPALIVIGAMMMTAATHVDWSDYTHSIPGLLAVVGMPFTYSITFGISLALMAHTLLMTLSGKARQVHPVLWALTLLIIGLEAGWIGQID